MIVHREAVVLQRVRFALRELEQDRPVNAWAALTWVVKQIQPEDADAARPRDPLSKEDRQRLQGMEWLDSPSFVRRVIAKLDAALGLAASKQE